MQQELPDAHYIVHRVAVWARRPSSKPYCAWNTTPSTWSTIKWANPPTPPTSPAIAYSWMHAPRPDLPRHQLGDGVLEWIHPIFLTHEPTGRVHAADRAFVRPAEPAYSVLGRAGPTSVCPDARPGVGHRRALRQDGVATSFGAGAAPIAEQSRHLSLSACLFVERRGKAPSSTFESEEVIVRGYLAVLVAALTLLAFAGGARAGEPLRLRWWWRCALPSASRWWWRWRTSASRWWWRWRTSSASRWWRRVLFPSSGAPR